MSLELTTWYNSRLNARGRVKSHEWSFTYEHVSGPLKAKYRGGSREEFQSIPEMARRIVQLYEEDPEHHLRFTNGSIMRYSDTPGAHEHGESFVLMAGESTATGRRLSEKEFEELTQKVLAARRGN